jgi:hypothetical protein
MTQAQETQAQTTQLGNVPDAYEVSLMVFDLDGQSYFVRVVPFAGTAEPGTQEAVGRWAWRPSDERRQVLVEATT